MFEVSGIRDIDIVRLSVRRAKQDKQTGHRQTDRRTDGQPEYDALNISVMRWECNTASAINNSTTGDIALSIETHSVK